MGDTSQGPDVMWTTSGSVIHTTRKITVLGGLGVVFVSLLLSRLAATELPAEIRIRWHLGTYEQWGPATVPVEIVTIVLPGMMVLGLILSQVTSRYVRSNEGRLALDLTAICTLIAMLFVQSLLIGLNLVIG